MDAGRHRRPGRRCARQDAGEPIRVPAPGETKSAGPLTVSLSNERAAASDEAAALPFSGSIQTIAPATTPTIAPARSRSEVPNVSVRFQTAIVAAGFGLFAPVRFG